MKSAFWLIWEQLYSPNGRKIYLHHWKKFEQFKKSEWETGAKHKNKHLDQKMRCQPMNAGQDFYFHIDFDNLSEAELGLLLTSLRPDEQFKHRLGLGKSLGLGSVEVAIEGVFLIDRVKRYLEDNLDAPRYHEVYRGSMQDKKDEWAALYPQEAAAWDKALDWKCLKQDMTLIDTKETLPLLQTVGNPANLKAEVKPPLANGQNDPEDKTFKWFVNNDNDKATPHHKSLPVIQANRSLPTMEQNAEPDKRGY